MEEQIIEQIRSQQINISIVDSDVVDKRLTDDNMEMIYKKNCRNVRQFNICFPPKIQTMSGFLVKDFSYFLWPNGIILFAFAQSTIIQEIEDANTYPKHLSIAQRVLLQGENQIEGEGIFHLCKGKWAHLKQLSLQKNKISTNINWLIRGSFSALESIWINFNNLTIEQVNNFILSSFESNKEIFVYSSLIESKRQKYFEECLQAKRTQIFND